MTMGVDVVIIGAGPAGMSAANTINKFGGNVVVLDEQAAPGGQIYKAIDHVRHDRPNELMWLGPTYSEGARLTEKFGSQEIDYRPGSMVWNIEGPTSDGFYTVYYSRTGKSRKLVTGYIIAATGAMERPVPIPGWTLPGVMSVGAIQSVMKNSGIYPSGKLILAGTGPLVLQLANQLIAANVDIAAILDTSPKGSFVRALKYFPRAAIAGDYLFKGWKLAREVQRSGVKIYRNVTDLAALGENSVQNVSFKENGEEHCLEVDTLALHEGILPNTQLTRLLDLKHVWSERQRSFYPVVDSAGETSRSGVFVVGDGAGISGSKTAEHSGVIAGMTILEKLDYIKESQRDIIVEEKKFRRFLDEGIRPFLDTLFPAPTNIEAISNRTIICRCEEITAGEIRDVVKKGCSGPNQAKAFLRCGMGVCQGRMCGASVTEVMSQAMGKTPSDVGTYRIRPPLKPLSLDEIATLNES